MHNRPLMMFRNWPIPKQRVAIAVLLLATWLRAPLLFTNGMHADEALFGTWANWIASGWDILLREQVVDKPPVLFYLQAIALRLFDKADFALRVPNFAASLGLVALAANVHTVGLSRCRESILFPLLLALSPFMIQFSGSGFTDPLMLFFGVAGLVAVRRTRFGWAGILFGLAIATKYTAIFLFPLLPLFTNRCNPSFPRWRESLQLTKGIMVVLLCLAGWLFLSGNSLVGTGDGLLIRGLRPITSTELLARLQIWNTHLHATFGLSFLPVFLPAAAFLHWRGTQHDRYLIATAIFYFAFHWLMATALYDRYMLPLAWMACYIVARALTLFVETLFEDTQIPKRPVLKNILAWCVRPKSILLVLTLIILLPSALSAHKHGYTTGRENFTPIGEILIDAPYGTVLYDHFYSWQLRYQLFYARVYVEWIPQPESLVENLALFYDESRYIVLPEAPIATRFHVALNEHGYTLQTLVQSGDVVLYRIVRR
jgi:4-amino-4-deoxy-L-arabinose transferase-like glycosyltransferase